MYKDGSLVTLCAPKSHGEGSDALRLNSGICGIIMRTEKKADLNHIYVVDFGPYGQWHCYHNELAGDDDGWDPDREEHAMVREQAPRLRLEEDEKAEDEKAFVVDLEADIARRTAELEKGY